jgi:type III secretion protein C
MKFKPHLLLSIAVISQMTLLEPPIYTASKTSERESKEDGYTINFENVPIQEFLKFISKIAGVNVIYSEADLNFNVTIVSEYPTDLNNILSALVQILRINGLTLIEEEKNFLIHKNENVKQIPRVVSQESPLDGKIKPPLMTKVFKIQKGNPSEIASLITPMISKDAIVEVSPDTRQIIITDVSSSIQTAEELLKSLDAPETPYDVDAYRVQTSDVKNLADTAKKILAPIAESTPLEIIANPTSKSVYIVSTPFLIDKAMSVLKDLDKLDSSSLDTGSFIVYHVKNLPLDDFQSLINNLTLNLKKDKLPNSELIKALENAKKIIETNSLLITGPQIVLNEANSLLQSLDQKQIISQKTNKEFLIYTPKHLDSQNLKNLIIQTAQNLKTQNHIDPNFLSTLENVKELSGSNRLIFSGNTSSISQVSTLLTTLDQLSHPDIDESIFVQLKNIKADEMIAILKQTAETLEKSKNSDIGLINVLKKAEATASGNTVILTGTVTNLKKAQEFITLNDTLDLKNNTLDQRNKEVIFVPINNRSAREIVSLLKETADALSKSSSPDIALIQTLKSADSTPNGHTVILTGSPDILKKAQELISLNDTQQKDSKPSEVFVYKMKYLSAAEIKLTMLGIAEHADTTQPSEETSSIIRAIQTLRVIPDSNAIQFVANGSTIAKIKEILTILDTPENAKSQVKQQFGSNFLVYKIKYLNSQDLLAQLKKIVKDAPNQDSLTKTVASAQYSPGSNSLVFTGDKADLDKIQLLLQNLDTGKESSVRIAAQRQAESYKIYKPQHVGGTELISMLKTFEEHLVLSGVTSNDLGEVIDHLTYLDRSNSLIITGKEQEISQVMSLLQEFDTEDAAQVKSPKLLEAGVETIDETGFLIYKLQHQSGAGIVQALSVISSDLNSQTTPKKNTNLIEAIKSTQWVEPTNSLIATGQPRVLAKLRELIESIDQPLKQVFIEILVVQSNNNDDLELGLSWGSQGKVNNRFSWGSGNYNINDVNQTDGTLSGFPTSMNQISGTRIPTGSDIPPVLGGFLGVIGDVIWHKGKSYANLGSLVKAFRSTGTITEVLAQKIVAQDNQNAKIFSGSNIPFTGSLVTTSGLSQTTNANLEYRNVGITVSITPIIGDNDIISLDIDYELSAEANQPTQQSTSITVAQANQVNGITTTKTSMQTKVHLPDRHFLVLSGTMQNTTTRNNNGIPCLGGLPLIGAAFSYNQKLSTTQNVLIFVKPHIIKTQEMFGQITKDQEEIFGNKNQTNVEDFQNGLELIRSADDLDNDDIK